jgi:hypothetical protein
MNKKLKASNSSNSMLELTTHSDATHNANDALADIRGWHQKLVARGDRLRELATREREALPVLDAAFEASAPAHLKRLA